MRDTRPVRGLALPPADMCTAAPTRICNASLDKTSITASSSAVSPMSSKGWPLVTVVALSWCSFSTCPLTGLVSVHTPAAGLPALGSERLSAARASASAKSVALCSARAALSDSCAVWRAKVAWSRAEEAMKLACASCSARWASSVACARAACSLSTWAAAAWRAALALPTRCCSTVRVRASIMGGATGTSVATASPARTVSPTLREGRSRAAEVGAVITKRFFRRNWPSSSMACSKVPTRTGATSTSNGLGR